MLEYPESTMRTRWTAVVAIGLAIVTAGIDITAVATGLPAISSAFGADPARSQWVVLAYILPMIALTIPAGRWLDTTSLRYAFAIAMVGFAGASVLAGAAPTFELLLAARALQGVFGALVSALLLAVAAAVVNPRERGRAMGLVATVGPLGAIAGPGLGGLLIATVGWRWIFFINVPVCVVALFVGWRAMPSQGRLAGLRVSLLVEAVLTGIAALGLLLALDEAAASGWSRPLPFLLIGVAVAALVVWGRLPATRSVVGALQQPALSGQLAALVLFAAQNGTLFFLTPFFLQNVLERSAAEAGAMFLAVPLSLALAAQVSGRAADRLGPQPAMVVGLLCSAAGGLLLLPLDPSWGTLDVVWRLGLMGLGAGFISPPNQSAIMAAAPAGTIGAVSGLSGVSRNLGYALGPALATVLWVGGQFAPDAMRPAFLLLVVLPLLSLGIVLAARPRASTAPIPSSRGTVTMAGSIGRAG
jgi:MFS family permease